MNALHDPKCTHCLDTFRITYTDGGISVTEICPFCARKSQDGANPVSVMGLPFDASRPRPPVIKYQWCDDVPPGLRVLPSRGTPGAAGYDLHAVESFIIRPNEFGKARTGLKVAIPGGYAGLICPRSGLSAKSGVTVLNGPGVIDGDFRGEVCVLLVNHGPKPCSFQAGDRIAQLLIVPVDTCDWQAGDLDATERADGGFGSTGMGPVKSGSVTQVLPHEPTKADFAQLPKEQPTLTVTQGPPASDVGLPKGIADIKDEPTFAEVGFYDAELKARVEALAKYQQLDLRRASVSLSTRAIMDHPGVSPRALVEHEQNRLVAEGRIILGMTSETSGSVLRFHIIHAPV
jgi:dUTP pyrophosphatase